MREWLVIVTEHAVVVIDAMALVIILAATTQAFITGLKAMASPATGHDRREVWLRFGRWLVAGLTFQLAADVIETSIRAGWESIGQLGAVAIIRTFLNYFLERDLAEARARQKESTGVTR